MSLDLDKLLYILGSITIALLVVVAFNVTPVYAASCTAECSSSGGSITCTDSSCECSDGGGGEMASCQCVGGDTGAMLCAN